jgi:hypothetical protein
MQELINSVISERKAEEARSDPAFSHASAPAINLDEVMKKVRIAVIGVGGAGCNAVTRLFVDGIESARTIVINTDSKHLHTISKAHDKFLLGKTMTKGMGAGGDAGRHCHRAHYVGQADARGSQTRGRQEVEQRPRRSPVGPSALDHFGKPPGPHARRR